MDLVELKALLATLDEQDEYEEYLETHIGNVQKGYQWLKDNIPEILSEDNYFEEITYYGELDEIIEKHDQSKYRKIPDAENYYDLTPEYDAYAEYFYGKDGKTPQVQKRFDLAWLAHIHANPHHWQHWMLQNDEDGLQLLDMPYVFIIEMICDWWSFSWKQNKLDEIFNWYEQRKDGILLSDKTRATLENILNTMKERLNDNVE